MKYQVGSILKDIGGSNYDKWSEDDYVDASEVELLVFYGKGDNCLDVLVDLGIRDNMGHFELNDGTWIRYLVLKIDGKPEIKAEIFEGPVECELINPSCVLPLKKKLKNKAKLPPITDKDLLKIRDDN